MSLPLRLVRPNMIRNRFVLCELKAKTVEGRALPFASQAATTDWPKAMSRAWLPASRSPFRSCSRCHRTTFMWIATSNIPTRMNAIRPSTVLETGADGDCGEGLSGFINLFQLQRCDRVHHPLAQTRVNIPTGSGKISICEVNRMTDNNRNADKAKATATARQSIVSAKDPHRHNRGARLGNDQADTGLPRLKTSVGRARSFRKDERAVPVPHDLDQSLQRAAVDSFLVNRDHIQLRQNPAKHRRIFNKEVRRIR